MHGGASGFFVRLAGRRAGGGRGSGPAAVPRVGRSDAAPCAGRAPAGGRGRTETPLQNSQRVLLAKPRTAAVSHRRRCGAAARVASRHGRIHRALPLRDTSMERGDGARDAKPHGVEHATGAGCQAAHRGGMPQAIGTSRPTATGHGRCARDGARAGSVRRRRARPNREYTSGA